jgi:hypothetical protein
VRRICFSPIRFEAGMKRRLDGLVGMRITAE